MRLVLDSSARAVWLQKKKLANILIHTSPLAGELISVDNGGVSLVNPAAFEEMFNSVRLSQRKETQRLLTQELQNANGSNVRKQLKSKLQAVRRLMSLHWPRGKRLMLAGIKTNEGVVTSPVAIQSAIIDYWRPVYSKKEIDEDAACKLLHVYCNRNRSMFNFTSISLPGLDDYVCTLKHVKDSATGIDGVPYSAYKANMDISARVFTNHSTFFSLPTRPPGLTEFNMQVVWFAPKGVQDEDKKAVYRGPDQLRTIFGGSSDNKIISSTIGNLFTPATLAITPSVQRGFCRGRQLSLNVVDLDAYMRAHNCMYNFRQVLQDISNVPCAALYDFCNAFPTVSQEWLFLVLKALGVPITLRWIIWWLYTDITAYSSGAGDGSFLFHVLAGVKTGCPFSSIAFLLAVNPIVDLFLYLSDGPKLSQTRVCADDFGSAMKALHALQVHASIFRLASKITGMRLKPAKCILIISGCVLTQELIDAVRSWLKVNVPDFQDFSITGAGKYLGWYLGRNSIALSYAAPLEKYASRVQEVVDGSAPATVAIVRYNQRVVPVLSYVAQFAAPQASKCLRLKQRQFSEKVTVLNETVDLADREHGAIHRILRMPPKCMSRELMHSIGFASIVSPTPVINYSLAIMYRFALSEKPYLYSLASDIATLMGDSLTVQLSQLGSRIPDGFLDSPPILLSLLEALEFQGPFLRVLNAIAADSGLSWLDQRGKSAEYSKKDKVQTVVLRALASTQDVAAIGNLVAKKLCITLGGHFASQCRLSVHWFHELTLILDEATQDVLVEVYFGSLDYHNTNA